MWIWLRIFIFAPLRCAVYSVAYTIPFSKGQSAMALRAKLRAYRWVLLGVAGTLLVCAALALLVDGAHQASLGVAKMRWDARSFAKYQLVVQEETQSSNCRQASEIHAEKVDRVLLNRCVRPASWTVSNLFLWAEQPGVPARCYPSAVTCVCYKVYSQHTSYDPLLGYPQSVTQAWHLRLNWAYMPHWQRLWHTGELPTCANIARVREGFVTITVVSLVPLR
jgi:hypothetical protein